MTFNPNQKSNGKRNYQSNNHHHHDPLPNPSIPPEREELQALFPLLEALVNQSNQIQAEQLKISQRIEDLAAAKPYLTELTNLASRLNQVESAHSQINQTQNKLIEAMDTQAQNQEQLSIAMILFLKSLQPDRPQQHKELENLQQNLSALRIQDIVPLKQHLSNLVQGVNNLTTSKLSNNHQPVDQKAQIWNSNASWRFLFAQALAFSFLIFMLNMLSLVIFQTISNPELSYLKIIHERLGWTNTKLERVEKKLGTDPNH